MNIFDVYAFFRPFFAKKRVALIVDRFPLLSDPKARVLDVGGEKYPWGIIQPQAKLTILNFEIPKDIPENCSWTYVKGDGTNLHYADSEFDLVFSNSVIEHVVDWEGQKKFAKELIRCGKYVYCQCPNQWFFFEPHFVAPFIHWFPSSITRRLLRWFSVWGWMTKPNQQKVDEFIGSIKLLNEREFRECFPGCEIYKEKFLGMTKSFIAVKGEREG
ncbi:MAG: class I SAM-dependent methyltransferase [Magnetococcales bacterium]|nr:class I SAM-dependent methyltransferase [Magnetococcales bacterium]